MAVGCRRSLRDTRPPTGRLLCAFLLLSCAAAAGALRLSPASAGSARPHRAPPLPTALRLRGGAPSVDGGMAREYAEAGKAIRGPQHLVDEWIEANFPLQTRKEWGHACLGLGACCVVVALVPLPLVNCFLSRKVLLAANVLLAAGAFLLSGPGSLRRFLFAPRRRLGTVVLAAGSTLVWRRWTLLGLLVEAVGFIGLFGPFLEGLPLVCPPCPTTLSGAARQARGLVATITAPVKSFMGKLDLERRDW
jgi:hypothetical protein